MDRKNSAGTSDELFLIVSHRVSMN